MSCTLLRTLILVAENITGKGEALTSTSESSAAEWRLFLFLVVEHIPHTWGCYEPRNLAVTEIATLEEDQD